MKKSSLAHVNMKRSFMIVAFFALMLSACTPNRHHDVDFYYWKSKCTIGETERDYFCQLKSKRLFVRLFDVDVEGNKAVPVGQIQSFGKDVLPSNSTQVIPVVFITNQTFLDYVSDSAVERLATNVNASIKHIMEPESEQFDDDLAEGKDKDEDKDSE